MKFPRSKTGLFFAGLYVVFASFLFYDAATCHGMLCELNAFAAVVPFGIVCIIAVKLLDTVYFFGSSYTSYSWGDIAFVIPTMIGNIIFYYWAGVFLAWIFKKVIPKKQEKV